MKYSCNYSFLIFLWVTTSALFEVIIQFQNCEPYSRLGGPPGRRTSPSHDFYLYRTYQQTKLDAQRGIQTHDASDWSSWRQHMPWTPRPLWSAVTIIPISAVLSSCASAQSAVCPSYCYWISPRVFRLYVCVCVYVSVTHWHRLLLYNRRAPVSVYQALTFQFAASCGPSRVI